MRDATKLMLTLCLWIGLNLNVAGAETPRGLRSQRRLALLQVEAQSGLRGRNTSALTLTQDRVAGFRTVPESPSALKHYCSGAQADVGSNPGHSGCEVLAGQEVKVNYKNYGRLYPATVTRVNEDGTYHVLYADGFQEENVPCSSLKLEEVGPPHTDPGQTDPVCAVSNEVIALQRQIDQAHEDVTHYLEMQSMDAGEAARRRRSAYAGWGRRRRAGAFGWQAVIPTPKFMGLRQLKEATDKALKEESSEPPPVAVIEGGRTAALELFDRLGGFFNAAADLDKSSDGKVSRDEVKAALEHLKLPHYDATELADDFMMEHGCQGEECSADVDVATLKLDIGVVDLVVSKAGIDKAASKLWRHYHGDAAKIAFVDGDEDSKVTEEELANAFKETCRESVGESKLLAKAIIMKYAGAPGGSMTKQQLMSLMNHGHQVVTDHKRLVEERERRRQEFAKRAAKESQAAVAPVPAPGPAGAPAKGPAPADATAPGAMAFNQLSPWFWPEGKEAAKRMAHMQQVDFVEDLREEVVERDHELLVIAETLHLPTSQVRELKGQVTADEEWIDSDIQDGVMEDIEEAQKRRYDRADAQDEFVERAEQVALDAAKTDEPRGMLAHDGNLLKALRAHGYEILATAVSLQKKGKVMEDKGSLDPELRTELATSVAVGRKMGKDMAELAEKELKVLLGATGMEEDLEETAKKHSHGSPGPAPPEDKDTREDMLAFGDDDEVKKEELALVQTTESALVEHLEALDRRLYETREVTHSFDKSVLPSSDTGKWWRYRWEYSYVESEILVLICFLGLFWESLHQLIRLMLLGVMRKNPMFSEDYFRSAIVQSWGCFAAGEMWVLLMVLMSLWLISRWGFWSWWIKHQYNVATDVHLPHESSQYDDLTRDIGVQLSAAMLLFMGAAWCLVKEAQGCIVQMQSFEEEEEMKPDELACGPLRTLGITNPNRYKEYKGHFYNRLQRFPDIDRSLRDAPEEDYLMYWYIGTNLKHCIEKTFMVHAITWLLLLLTFLCFATIERYFGWSYMALQVIAVVAFLLLLLGTITQVRKAAAALEGQMNNDARTTKTEKHSARDSLVGSAVAYQFPLFFMCYGLTRLICSSWMWTFYWYQSAALTIMSIFMALLFIFVYVPAAVAYFIALAFPPFLNSEQDKIWVERARIESQRKKAMERIDRECKFHDYNMTSSTLG